MQCVLHKTLIIRLSSVGDVVLSSPLVRSLRGRYPDCQIDFLVKAEYADLMRFNPHISHLLEFPTNGSFGDLVRLRRVIAASAYDLIIDIHDSLRSRVLCAGTGRVQRIRKRKFARAMLVRFKMNLYNHTGGAPSVAERYLETVHPYGVADDRRGLELFVPEHIRATVQTLLAGEHIQQGTPCIGVCPSAKHMNKMWPGERFADAAGALASRHGMPVLLFGAPEEADRCALIAQRILSTYPGTLVVNLAGWTSLLETAAAMDHCAVVMSNDTGLMHIAVARSVPLVAIFGPTVRQFGFFPPADRATILENEDLACRPCTHIGLSHCPKRHFLCMNDISVESVIEAAERRMAGA